MERSSGRPPGFAKAEHSAANRQLSPAADQGRLATFTLRDIQSGGRRAFLQSGGDAAALRYSCLGSVIATLAIRLPKIPNTEYFHDFGLISSLPLIEEPPPACTELNKIFRYELKLSESGRAQILGFLLLMKDLPRLPASPPYFYASQN